MFELPSIGNLIVSTVVFFVAAWYLHRYFDEQDLPRGLTRNVLVIVLASMVSWASGNAVDWAHEKFIEPKPTLPTTLESPPTVR